MWAARPRRAERSTSLWSPFTSPPGAPAATGVAVTGEVAWRGLPPERVQAVRAPSRGTPLWVPREP